MMEIEKMNKILSEEIKKFECEQREEDRLNLRKLLREQAEFEEATQRTGKPFAS